MARSEEIFRNCPYADELKGHFPFPQCTHCPHNKYDDEEGLLYCDKAATSHE